MIRLRTILVSSFALALTACAGKQEAAPAAGEAPAAAPAAARLTTTLQALGDSGVGGTLTFTAMDGGVMVEGDVTGLEPGSTHGFHIHEKGDCSSPDGKSAGGHFNPAGVDHGGLDADPSHGGDLGNAVADDAGVAHISKMKHGITLTEGDGAILGRGVIVHADPDDLKSQPTGAAGARVACGVIVAAE